MNGSSETQLSRYVWETRYRSPDAQPPETDIRDTWRRVARAVAAAEPHAALWSERFLSALQDFRLLPGGRILAGAGTSQNVTLSNCFVMGPIEDSIEGIFQSLKEGALTIQQGGGVGYDFSTLRPHGAPARVTGRIASGPVSFMQVWESMCATLLATGVRQGAMMASLRCDHPDIEAFIDAKRAPHLLPHFNLSVQVTEQFMQAVRDDEDWPLLFPDPAGTLERTWSGSTAAVACRIHRVIRARDLWKRLCDGAYDCAEPGVLFIDRINGENNLAYCEQLTTTNPCAEAPLPAYDSCPLASINLTAFVREPFTARARLDESEIADVARVAVRFLDDVVEISKYPLARQREQAQRSRRLGLGVTGLADALAMLELRYDSEPARSVAARALSVIRDAAYEASIELAHERGTFPAYSAEHYLQRPFIAALPAQIRKALTQHGIRNSHLLAIAPAGSISRLARHISSGIEPMFGIETLHRVATPSGDWRNFQVTNGAYALWRSLHDRHTDKPDCFVEADAIAPRDHLLMQAALAPYVDGGIAKAITIPKSFARSDVGEIFNLAHVLGLKGCTVFRAAAHPSATSRDEDEERTWVASAEEYGCTSGRATD